MCLCIGSFFFYYFLFEIQDIQAFDFELKIFFEHKRKTNTGKDIE